MFEAVDDEGEPIPVYLLYNRLVGLGVRPFRTSTREAMVAWCEGGSVYTGNPKEDEFKGWVRRFFATQGNPLPKGVLNSVAQLFADQALRPDLPVRRVVTPYARIAPNGPYHAVLDLCDGRGTAIVVGREGWNLTTSSLPRFRRSDHMQPLPLPATGTEAGFDQLWKFVGVEDLGHRLLLTAALVQNFMPDTPKPLIVFAGPRGSGKSTSTRFVVSVLDPSATKALAPPREDQDLIHYATHYATLPLDNISSIRPDLSDDLCRLVTGLGLTKRRLYTNDGEVIVRAKPWIILNGIGAIPTRGDLLDRTLIFEITPPASYTPDAVLDAEWERDHPEILGAVLDLAAKTLAELSKGVTLSGKRRMADFEAVGLAMCTATGRNPAEFQAALDANDALVRSQVAEDPWLQLLVRYAISKGAIESARAIESVEVTESGTTAEIAERIRREDPEAVRALGPNAFSAGTLGRALTRLSPDLRRFGITATKRHTERGTVWTFARKRDKTWEGVRRPSL